MASTRTAPLAAQERRSWLRILLEGALLAGLLATSSWLVLPR